jgi:hypothetical protein
MPRQSIDLLPCGLARDPDWFGRRLQELESSLVTIAVAINLT